MFVGEWVRDNVWFIVNLYYWFLYSDRNFIIDQTGKWWNYTVANLKLINDSQVMIKNKALFTNLTNLKLFNNKKYLSLANHVWMNKNKLSIN